MSTTEIPHVSSIRCAEAEANVYDCRFNSDDVKSRGVQEFFVEDPAISRVSPQLRVQIGVTVLPVYSSWAITPASRRQ